MPPKKPVSDFSIDDFIGEIEKAEAEQLNKRLPQERLKNKRALDNAARRAAEAAGTGIQPLVPQPLEKPKKSARSAATGMQLKAPKSKANSVDRPDFGGMGESDQAGFGHLPSGRVTARDISRQAAKDPEVMEQLREALETSKKKVKAKNMPGQSLAGAQTVGISATVKALEDIILHGRKSRPAISRAATAIKDLVEGVGNADRTRCCSASPAPARPSPWPR
jgi:excinuclease ABC subunit B